MDFASIIGILAGVALIAWAIWSGGEAPTFINLASLAITVGGTIAATFLAFPLPRVLKVFLVLKNVFKKNPFDAQKIITDLVELSKQARRNGILSLEDQTQMIQNQFLKGGIQMVVDGNDPEVIRDLMEIEMLHLKKRHDSGEQIFKVMAKLSPAFGMIGTLIGLVTMLQKLDNPKTVGPSMAVALITTLYGSMMANMVFIPIANKLSLFTDEELIIMSIIIEGVLGIQAGMNPTILQKKLEAFLLPKDRSLEEL